MSRDKFFLLVLKKNLLYSFPTPISTTFQNLMIKFVTLYRKPSYYAKYRPWNLVQLTRLGRFWYIVTLNNKNASFTTK